MRMRLGFGWVLGVGAVSLAACGLGTGGGPREPVATEVKDTVRAVQRARTAKLVLHPPFGRPGIAVQVVVNEWTAADVEHLVVQVFEVNPII